MAYSFKLYNGDGNTTIYPVNIPYIEKSHVKVYVDGVDTPYEWLHSGSVQLTTAPPSGSQVKVKRETPREQPLVDFQSGTNFTERELDMSTLQMLYVVQEAYDTVTNVMGKDDSGAYDAAGNRITNLEPPVNNDDAVNLGYLDTWTSVVQALHDATVAHEQGTAEKAAQAAASAQAALEAAQILETTVRTSIPDGGNAGQIPVKQGDTTIAWQDVKASIPGGTPGQKLVKQADGSADWEDLYGVPADGRPGQVLMKKEGVATEWQDALFGGLAPGLRNQIISGRVKEGYPAYLVGQEFLNMEHENLVKHSKVGTVSASAIYSNSYNEVKPLRNQVVWENYGWMTPNGQRSGWWQYDFTEEHVLTGLFMLPSDNAAANYPKDWELQGWDGSAWETIYSRPNDQSQRGYNSNTKTNGRMYWFTENTKAYKRVRINVQDTADVGNNRIDIAVIRFYEAVIPGQHKYDVSLYATPETPFMASVACGFDSEKRPVDKPVKVDHSTTIDGNKFAENSRNYVYLVPTEKDGSIHANLDPAKATRLETLGENIAPDPKFERQDAWYTAGATINNGKLTFAPEGYCTVLLSGSYSEGAKYLVEYTIDAISTGFVRAYAWPHSTYDATNAENLGPYVKKPGTYRHVIETDGDSVQLGVHSYNSDAVISELNIYKIEQADAALYTDTRKVHYGSIADIENECLALLQSRHEVNYDPVPDGVFEHDMGAYGYPLNFTGVRVFNTEQPRGAKSSYQFSGGNNLICPNPDLETTFKGKNYHKYNQDFTMEIDFKYEGPTPEAADNYYVIFDSGWSGSKGWSVNYYNRRRVLGIYWNADQYFSVPFDASDREWHTLSVSKCGTRVFVHVDGKCINTFSEVPDVKNGLGAWYIGRWGHTNGNRWTGYLNNLRYTLGTALYQGEDYEVTPQFSRSLIPHKTLWYDAGEGVVKEWDAFTEEWTALPMLPVGHVDTGYKEHLLTDQPRGTYHLHQTKWVDPNGYATSGQYNGSYTPACLFDFGYGGDYIYATPGDNHTTEHYVRFTLEEPMSFEDLRICNTNWRWDAYPVKFILKGSNDGTTWTTLVDRSSGSVSDGGSPNSMPKRDGNSHLIGYYKKYPITDSAPYKMYQLHLLNKGDIPFYKDYSHTAVRMTMTFAGAKPEVEDITSYAIGGAFSYGPIPIDVNKEYHFEVPFGGAPFDVLGYVEEKEDFQHKRRILGQGYWDATNGKGEIVYLGPDEVIVVTNNTHLTLSNGAVQNSPTVSTASTKANLYLTAKRRW